MARYIDADKLAAAIDSVIADDTDDIIFIRTGKWHRGAFIRTKRVKRMAEELTEDVELVKRGKWEWENGDSYDSSGKRCSICGTMKDSVYSNYCPNCGAKMGERRETE